MGSHSGWTCWNKRQLMKLERLSLRSSREFSVGWTSKPVGVRRFLNSIRIISRDPRFDQKGLLAVTERW